MSDKFEVVSQDIGSGAFKGEADTAIPVLVAADTKEACNQAAIAFYAEVVELAEAHPAITIPDATRLQAEIFQRATMLAVHSLEENAAEQGMNN